MEGKEKGSERKELSGSGMFKRMKSIDDKISQVIVSFYITRSFGIGIPTNLQLNLS